MNFLIVAPLLFPWFTKANQPFELAIHMVFGALESFAALPPKRYPPRHDLTPTRAPRSEGATSYATHSGTHDRRRP